MSRSHDAFEHEHEIEPGWTGGDFQFDDEPPATERGVESGERKWWLVGAGICGLVTAGVVLALNVGVGDDPTGRHLELPATAFREVSAEPPAAVEPAPVPEPLHEPRDSTLAAAVVSPDIQMFHDAPPAPPLLADEAEPEADPETEPQPEPKVVVATDPKPAAAVVEPVPAQPSAVVKPALHGLPSIEDEDADDMSLPSIERVGKPAQPVGPSENEDADLPGPSSFDPASFDLESVDQASADLKSVDQAAVADQAAAGQGPLGLDGLVDVSRDDLPTVLEH